jgi:hypothetical protein
MQVERMHVKLRTQLKPNILFDPCLNSEKKITAMNKLNEYLVGKRMNGSDFATLDKTDLIIGTYYAINDNGSVQIPWNWYINE